MKIQTAVNKSLKSNLEESTNFEIGNTDAVINILRSKIYSNPRMTLVQEYLSNARDANREIDATKPIKVVMPNEISPVLKIRDYGPGLTRERVRQIKDKAINNLRSTSRSKLLKNYLG